jgi:hypothetical protein
VACAKEKSAQGVDKGKAFPHNLLSLLLANVSFSRKPANAL